MTNLPETMVAASRVLRAKQHTLMADIVELTHRRSMAAFQVAQCEVLKIAVRVNNCASSARSLPAFIGFSSC
jgi:hypothetical protein